MNDEDDDMVAIAKVLEDAEAQADAARMHAEPTHEGRVSRAAPSGG
jgi:hypothetical protein